MFEFFLGILQSAGLLTSKVVNFVLEKASEEDSRDKGVLETMFELLENDEELSQGVEFLVPARRILHSGDSDLIEWFFDHSVIPKFPCLLAAIKEGNVSLVHSLLGFPPPPPEHAPEDPLKWDEVPSYTIPSEVAAMFEGPNTPLKILQTCASTSLVALMQVLLKAKKPDGGFQFIPDSSVLSVAVNPKPDRELEYRGPQRVGQKCSRIIMILLFDDRVEFLEQHFDGLCKGKNTELLSVVIQKKGVDSLSDRQVAKFIRGFAACEGVFPDDPEESRRAVFSEREHFDEMFSMFEERLCSLSDKVKIDLFSKFAHRGSLHQVRRILDHSTFLVGLASYEVKPVFELAHQHQSLEALRRYLELSGITGDQINQAPNTEYVRPILECVAAAKEDYMIGPMLGEKKSSKLEIVRFLLDHGVDPSANNGGVLKELIGTVAQHRENVLMLSILLADARVKSMLQAPNRVAKLLCKGMSSISLSMQFKLPIPVEKVMEIFSTLLEEVPISSDDCLTLLRRSIAARLLVFFEFFWDHPQISKHVDSEICMSLLQLCCKIPHEVSWVAFVFLMKEIFESPSVPSDESSNPRWNPADFQSDQFVSEIFCGVAASGTQGLLKFVLELPTVLENWKIPSEAVEIAEKRAEKTNETEIVSLLRAARGKQPIQEEEEEQGEE